MGQGLCNQKYEKESLSFLQSRNRRNHKGKNLVKRESMELSPFDRVEVHILTGMEGLIWMELER